MVVAKFGGSSLSDGENWRRVLNIVKEGNRQAVVVSAPGARFVGDAKVPDLLFKYAASDKEQKEILWRKVADRYVDIANFFGIDFSSVLEETKLKLTGASVPYVVSRGEYLSARLFSLLSGKKFIDAARVVKFDEKGEIAQRLTYQLIEQSVLQSGQNAVMGGFYGSDKEDNIVLFERGGSDVSGAIVAAAVNAEKYENWTDVSGVFCCDPRIVLNPVFVKCLSFFQMKILALLGARVLHPQTIYPTVKKSIPINVKSIYHPDEDGTWILPTTKKRGDVVGITAKKVVSVEQIEFKTPLTSPTPLLSIITPAFCRAVFDEETFDATKITGDGGLTPTHATLISVVYDGKKNYCPTIKKALEKTGLPANVICDEHGLAACLTAPDKTAEALRTVYKALE